MRVLNPVILETKQELLQALRNGDLTLSKYNTLNEREKLFVELIAFGGYTAEQAIRAIDPNIRSPGAIGNRMLANKDIADTLEELCVNRDKKFLADISNTRDIALEKLRYIMVTTKDDTLAAACAKTILNSADTATKQLHKDSDESVGRVQFVIKTDNVSLGVSKDSSERIIIPCDEADIVDAPDAATDAIRKSEGLPPLPKPEPKPVKAPPDYKLAYEGVDHYNKKKNPGE